MVHVDIDEETRKQVETRYAEFSRESKFTPGINKANNPNVRPQWLDESLMVRARALSSKYFASLFLCHFAGLLLLFQMPTLLVPVFATATHNTIEKLFLRYLDTFVHLKRWYETSIFDSQSTGSKSIKKVNLMHQKVFRDVNPDLTNRNEPNGKLKMTQYDMTITQWSSIAPVILFPKQFGLHEISKAELQAFAHHWRAVGHTLGIEDRFNCCADTLEESQYFCKLILEREFIPQLKQAHEEKIEIGFQMANGLARAMNCLTGGWICLHGLFRYVIKTVLDLPNYVPVKNRKGYRNLVHLLNEMLKKWYWHWIMSWLVRFALVCVGWRKNTIAQHYRKHYKKIDFLEKYHACPFAKNWQ